MRLAYWYAPCLNDSDAYSIRTKTKREALAELAERALAKFERWSMSTTAALTC
jgi:hypothetical protein